MRWFERKVAVVTGAGTGKACVLLIAREGGKVWDQTMATNLRGTLLCCRHRHPTDDRPRRWRDRQHVVVPGAQGVTSGRRPTAASKAAMNLLAASLASQYGHAQIRCKAVEPDLIMTWRFLTKLDGCMQWHLP